MSLPPDVPVHRGRVGAMRLASGHTEYPVPYGFKPYVYRGTGKDTLTAYMDEKSRPERRAPRRKRKPVPKPRPPRNPKPENILRPYREEPVDLAPAQWVEPLPKQTVPPTPAPGWRPTSGAEIEQLLAELEDT